MAEAVDTLSASLQRVKTPHLNEYLRYDTKQSDGEFPVMLGLPSLPGPLWLGVVASDMVLSMGQIELNCVLKLNWIAWNRTVLTQTACLG